MVSEPAYVKAFKEYTRGEVTLSDLGAMEKEIYEGTDRACGILLASMVEMSLTKAIKSIMRPDVGAASDVFGFGGPLQTFSAKVQLGYAFGLFKTKTRGDLDLIRQMRNQFAHCRRPLKFADPAVRGMCAHLRLPDLNESVTSPLIVFIKKKATQSALADMKDPRTRFVRTCQTIAYQLVMFSERSHRTPIERSKLP